jgi:hypothetical protein
VRYCCAYVNDLLTSAHCVTLFRSRCAYRFAADRTYKRSRAIAIHGVFRFRLMFMRRLGR